MLLSESRMDVMMEVLPPVAALRSIPNGSIFPLPVMQAPYSSSVDHTLDAPIRPILNSGVSP